MEYAPKRGVGWYPKELPAAERAVEAARQAGKDKECPDEFRAVEKMKNDAYDIYLSCRTKEGIAMAIEAANRANALCPKKAVIPPPPAPTVSLSASPAAIEQGQCATLTWSSANVSSASIDQGVGKVDPSGSRQVCPKSTTPYTIAAVGAGGSRTASTTVTVKPKVIDRLTLHVNFDFDKAAIRNADTAELQKAVDFVKKYPGYKISIEGHTDNIGTEKYNQGLSERRAAAVKEYLLKQGVTDGARLRTVGYGESQPVADNSTAEGRFKNRRVEILILSE
jgi:OOP family OmpA-OmpF porin